MESNGKPQNHGRLARLRGAASQAPHREMIHVPKQGPRPEGRRGSQATNMESQIRFCTVDGPRGRKRANDCLNRVPEGGAESLHRRVRQGNARGQVMYQKPIRAKNQVGKARDAVLRG